jgi:hypothetical protein
MLIPTYYDNQAFTKFSWRVFQATSRRQNKSCMNVTLGREVSITTVILLHLGRKYGIVLDISLGRCCYLATYPLIVFELSFMINDPMKCFFIALRPFQKYVSPQVHTKHVKILHNFLWGGFAIPHLPWEA